MLRRYKIALLLTFGLLCAGLSYASTPLAPHQAELLDLIFADGFESGNLTEWDNATGDPPGTSLPPDPSTIAPAIDPTVAFDPYAANTFLWTAAEPVQVGVEPNAIDPRRISLLRGRVLERGGAPLRGVRVTVHGDSDLGFTYSRADGVFDIVANGGGLVKLVYEKSGYFPIVRSLQAPKQDYASLEDAIMIEADEQVTEISSGATEMQVARGSIEMDADGSRQATLLFPAGITAEMFFPDGNSVPLSTLHVRATEYTVGEQGPASMPAPLPENSGFTYAVELSADEAIAAGATSIELSEPVPVYLENFLGFPAGEPVPAGFFDRERAEWVPEPNGLVIEILSVTTGMADLDVDGSGTPASAQTLAELGISDAERTRLAALYSIGQQLWRVPVTHFTPWDFNWPAAPPDDAEPPPDPEDAPPPPDEPPPPGPDPDPEDGLPEESEPDCMFGSIIECENQTLRESVPLVGVPYRLRYASDRAKGRTNRSYFKVRLSDGSIPPSLTKIALGIWAGGSVYGVRLDPAPNLVHEVTWTSLDRFGRPLHSETPVTFEITYEYPLRYYSTKDDWLRAFSRLPGGSATSLVFPLFR